MTSRLTQGSQKKCIECSSSSYKHMCHSIILSLGKKNIYVIVILFPTVKHIWNVWLRISFFFVKYYIQCTCTIAKKCSWKTLKIHTYITYLYDLASPKSTPTIRQESHIFVQKSQNRCILLKNISPMLMTILWWNSQKVVYMIFLVYLMSLP